MPSLMTRLRRALAPAPEQKTSRAGQLFALQAYGQPYWTSRNESALAREGYERNAICHRCVRMIAEAVASIPWLIYEGETEAADHPLRDLLARPNPFDSGVGFIETLCANLMLYGNAYVEAATLDGVLREFYALRPDRMSVVPGRNGWPAAFVYRAGADETRYELRGDGLDPVLHIRLFNPFDDYYGLAPLAAAQMALDTHNAASFWNKALLDNSARPSGALVYARPDGAHLTDAQFTRLKEELEENFSGALNAGRPLLLEGGLDWKALSLSPRDMDFSQTRDSAAREIALAFGVPPLLLGLPGDNTYSNFQEANRAFWRQTAIPLAGRLHKSFAAWLTPAYGSIRFDADLDHIDALAEERALEWRRIGAADFLTLDERRQAAGYGPAPEGFAAQGVAAQGGVAQGVLAKGSGGKESAALEIRYSADQPRAPAGTSTGGRWIPAGGGGGGGGGGEDNAAQNILIAANDDPKIANDADNDPTKSAYAEKPVDILDHQGGDHRGHAMDHVAKSHDQLRRITIESRRRFGPLGYWKDRVGSFTSLEAANKLVNMTLAKNRKRIEAVARGKINGIVVHGNYTFKTGYESFAPKFNSSIQIRDTYGVTVVIVHNSKSPVGFFIKTAYPDNP